jgi:inorganic pyrophosphatase
MVTLKLQDSDIKDSMQNAPLVEVVIEVPRGSFVKRRASGRLDYVSPFPCPFNYGSVDAVIGPEGDPLDAVVLGPRLSRGARISVPAMGAVWIFDRGLSDDKLICSENPIDPRQRKRILLFFKIHTACKRLLNLLRGYSGPTQCRGWIGAEEAILKASIRNDAAPMAQNIHIRKK